MDAVVLDERNVFRGQPLRPPGGVKRLGALSGGLAGGLAGGPVFGPRLGLKLFDLGHRDGLVSALAARRDDGHQTALGIDQGAARIAGLAEGVVVKPGQGFAGGGGQQHAARRIDPDSPASDVGADGVKVDPGGILGGGPIPGGFQVRGAEQDQVAGITARHHVGQHLAACRQKYLSALVVGDGVTVGDQQPRFDQHRAGGGIEGGDRKYPLGRRADRVRGLAPGLCFRRSGPGRKQKGGEQQCPDGAESAHGL